MLEELTDDYIKIRDEFNKIYETYLPKFKDEPAFDYLVRCNEFSRTSKHFDKFRVSSDEMLKYIQTN